MFCNYIYNDTKKLYIFVGKLFSSHATVCTSYNTAGIKRSRTELLLKRGREYANHPDPEAMHAGGTDNHRALPAPDWFAV